jgi:hypothetical protein
MLTLFITALAAQPAAAPLPVPEPETIVVTGTRRGKCRIRLADRALSDRQFEAHAGAWARLGRAIRVVHPARTDHLCLARIAFRLNDRGVRVFHFVEQAEGR